MIFYITFLRCIAACLITNAHYTGIYPTDIIANGGLLGDVIFFAVSGFCLYHVKGSFPRWYGKRLLRIYPQVIIITAVYMLTGSYGLETNNFFWWFIYPTYYHFVASIIVLYIPFYAIMKIEAFRKRLPWFMAGIAAIFVLVYVFAYDKTYYHIDTVREPMIWFLFFESMLLGAWFRQHDESFRMKRQKMRVRVAEIIVTILSCGVYFLSKWIFSSREGIAEFQIFNQLALFILLFFILLLFSGWDGKLERWPAWLKKCIRFVADLTLEIYVVQYVLIDVIRPLFGFPLNWFVLTASILIAAAALHYLVKYGKLLIVGIVDRIKQRRKADE